MDHVINDISAAVIADLHWRRMDYAVHAWLYSTVTPDLIEIATTPSPIARSLWHGLEDEFISNKETRAMILDAEFRTFVQGELSISDYYRHLKAMADALGDLGEVVIDCTLILVVLRTSMAGSLTCPPSSSSSGCLLPLQRFVTICSLKRLRWTHDPVPLPRRLSL
jgi:hypothetical protein